MYNLHKEFEVEWMDIDSDDRLLVLEKQVLLYTKAFKGSWLIFTKLLLLNHEEVETGSSAGERWVRSAGAMSCQSWCMDKDLFMLPPLAVIVRSASALSESVKHELMSQPLTNVVN